jgi:hypothetical protein
MRTRSLPALARRLALASSLAVPSLAHAGDAANLFSSLIDGTLASINVNVPITVTGPGGTVLSGEISDGFFDPTQGLANLSNSTFSQLQENFPVASTVAAFTYEYDPTLNVFVRSQEGLGPILGERAKTTGKGKLNVAFATSRVTFDVFEGKKLSKLPVSLGGTTPTTLTGGGSAGNANGSFFFDFAGSNAVALGAGSSGFVFDPAVAPQVSDSSGSLPAGIYTMSADLPTVRMNADIDANIFAFFLNYGVLDRLDVGLVIPIIQLDLDARVTVNGLQGDSGPITNYANSGSESTVGLGDIVLRAKYHFYQSEDTGIAVRGDLWIPTGDEDELRGLGEVAGTIQLIGSTRWRWFSPHASIGLFIRGNGGNQDSARYQIGTDIRVHEKMSVSLDVVMGDDLERDNVGDFTAALSSGVKINPWRRLVIGANALWRLNDEGLRDDVIPSLSVEYTFR